LKQDSNLFSESVSNLSINQGHIVFTFPVQVHCSYKLEFIVVHHTSLRIS